LNHSMISASVTLHALQQRLDVLSNNMANSGTVGYKKKQTSFEDVLTSMKQQPEHFTKPGRMTPPGLNQTWGARIAMSQIDMTQGSLKQTDNPFDLAIEGDGLFEVEVRETDAAGNVTPRPAWTRNGSFGIKMENGLQMLTTQDGQYVRNTDDLPIILPPNTKLSIDRNGRMLAYDKTNPNVEPEDLGQLKMVRVIRPQFLEQMGDNLFVLPNNINRDIVMQDAATIPEEDPDKVLVTQGALEQSNVDLTKEMTDVIMVQRAFQLMSRALTSSDMMMGLANNLRS